MAVVKSEFHSGCSSVGLEPTRRRAAPLSRSGAAVVEAADRSESYAWQERGDGNKRDISPRDYRVEAVAMPLQLRVTPRPPIALDAACSSGKTPIGAPHPPPTPGLASMLRTS